MYRHHDFGSHHNVGESSSQPNVDGSSSQPNVGGSLSPVRHFSLDDDDLTQMYPVSFRSRFVRSGLHIEETEEIQVPVRQKKPNRRRQTAPKKKPQKEKAVDQRCIPWTPEEETALCKGLVHMSEDSVKDRASKSLYFLWCVRYTIMMYTNGAGDTDYLQRALIDYQAKYGVPFTLLHCWEVLKESDKWSSREVPLFMQEREDGKNKIYKSSGSSSFNTKESREGSINLNTTELELKAADLKIRRMENRQRDEALYETKTDEELKAGLSPLRYQQGDEKQITVIDFKGLKELKTDNDVQILLRLGMKTNVMIEESNKVDFQTKWEENVVIKNLTTHEPFLNKLSGNYGMSVEGGMYTRKYSNKKKKTKVKKTLFADSNAESSKSAKSTKSSKFAKCAKSTKSTVKKKVNVSAKEPSKGHFITMRKERGGDRGSRGGGRGAMDGSRGATSGGRGADSGGRATIGVAEEEEVAAEEETVVAVNLLVDLFPEEEESMDVEIYNRTKASINFLVNTQESVITAKESWTLLEDLALYDNESWNDLRDFAKPAKEISLPQDVPSTSGCCLIELKNQVPRLMEPHLAPKNMSSEQNLFFIQSNIEGLVSNFMASQDARLSKFEFDFKQQQGEMTNKINTALKVIPDRITRALPNNTVKTPKLNANSTTVLFAQSYLMEDPQCSTRTYRRKKEDNPKNIDTTPPSPPDPSVSFITEKVHKLDSFLEPSDLVPQSSDTEFVCTKDDGDFNHRPEVITSSTKEPFVEISNMTHDPSIGVVKFTDGFNEIAYKKPHKIERYDSLSDLEKEHTESVYLRNEVDKRRGVAYVMSKILTFYKECLELGPEYLTGVADEGEVT
uniref:Retrotransposon Orf1 n=1 Tax=Tanacetum cinerariifolium TaxID=118510 RepID=A0A6L2JPN1_TANCI|nr:retrotransposon Orf1 [Tanacetum cinerariifolium]